MKLLCRASNQAEISEEKLHASGSFAGSLDAQNLSVVGQSMRKIVAKSP